MGQAIASVAAHARRTVFVVVCIAAAAAGGAVLASAAIPDGGGDIHGCYGSVGGILRVIDKDKGAECLRGERSLTWSQRGPQGSAGAPGPAGVSTGFFVSTQSTRGPITTEPNRGLAEVGLPAGRFIVNGKLTLQNTSDREPSYAACYLLTSDSTIDVSPTRMAAGQWVNVPIAGGVDLSAPDRIRIECQLGTTENGPTDALYASITAVQVDTLNATP